MAIMTSGFVEGSLPEELMQILVKLAQMWEDVADPNDIQVKHMSGAMTNEVFQIKWPSEKADNHRKVLVRIYGKGVDVFFNRDEEIRTFECLSKHGQGPRLLGRFPEGRVEEFIHARTLSAADLRDPEISAGIAAKMWEFHNLEMPGSKETVLWNRMRNWVKKAKNLCSSKDDKEFGLTRLEDEIQMLKKELSKDGTVVGFCHNDLQYGNIMIDEEKGSITLIDYEYSSYNPIAYDLANHFCEMAADYHSETPHILDYSKYPDLEERRRFARAYLSTSGEIVPLNAGNVFGYEDNRPALKWENIIRETLNRVRTKRKYKSFSDPPSPSKFKPSDDAPDIEDEMLLEKYSDSEEVHPVEEDPCGFCEGGGNTAAGYGNTAAGDGTMIESVAQNEEESATYIEKHLQKQFSSLKGIDRLRCSLSSHYEKDDEESVPLLSVKLSKAFSGTERMDLSWPEPPLNLLAQHVFNRKLSFGQNAKSLKSLKSIRTYRSFNSIMNDDQRSLSVISGIAKLDLEKLIHQRRPEYVRIVSKQMVGIFITIWVRRGLRKHVKNLKVSTVGVGVMGYIGNKGSISVSMSIYQTLFCFICTHLSSGEKDGDELKRNADVYEIQRRTHFYHSDGLPKNIHDHERIVWLGDLNYRINLPYQKTRELISKQDWTKLVERDQLKQQLTEGRAFEGWYEGMLNFPPTYKYEPNMDKYYGDDPKVGRRNPAWCDRILSFGNGIELLNYKRAELKLSDHRPVAATFTVEVEDVCPRRLQRALTFTDAEIEKQ